MWHKPLVKDEEMTRSEKERIIARSYSGMWTLNEDEPEYKVMLRQRSKSLDAGSDFLEEYNMKTKFGMQYYEVESNPSSNRKKVGPLKIIRLPSDRSMPQSHGIYNSIEKDRPKDAKIRS